VTEHFRLKTLAQGRVPERRGTPDVDDRQAILGDRKCAHRWPTEVAPSIVAHLRGAFRTEQKAALVIVEQNLPGVRHIRQDLRPQRGHIVAELCGPEIHQYQRREQYL
jgi:hypothetical protein